MLTLKFNNVYINDWEVLTGIDEKNGKLKINSFIDDLYFDEDTFENAEIKMQRTVLDKIKIRNNIDLVIGGDLSNQIANMNCCMENYNLSFLGVYNACSTFIESLLIGASILSKGNNTICLLTSSHVNVAERQFRYPNEYGSLKAGYTTTTITASIASIISSKKSNFKVVNGTIGRVVDYGVKDVSNIGAIMAPAAKNIIVSHLKNTKTKIDDYDLILTGDLGIVGINILKELLSVEDGICAKNIIDAGTLIYKSDQGKLMGGSGPSVIPLVLFNKILKSNYKKILLVGTGALHNTTIVNQHRSIPAIAHAIEIEVMK